MDLNNSDIGVSMDDLLDGTLDDLKDMPAFKVFPAGAYKCKITWEMKEIANQKAPEIKLTHVETLEVNDPQSTPPEPGDECAMAFLFKMPDGKRNEFTEGAFKNIMQGLKSLVTGVDNPSPRQIMEASNGAEVSVLTDVRLKDKKDKNSAQYLTIKEVMVE